MDSLDSPRKDLRPRFIQAGRGSVRHHPRDRGQRRGSSRNKAEVKRGGAGRYNWGELTRDSLNFVPAARCPIAMTVGQAQEASQTFRLHVAQPNPSQGTSQMSQNMFPQQRLDRASLPSYSNNQAWSPLLQNLGSLSTSTLSRDHQGVGMPVRHAPPAQPASTNPRSPLMRATNPYARLNSDVIDQIEQITIFPERALIHQTLEFAHPTYGPLRTGLPLVPGGRDLPEQLTAEGTGPGTLALPPGIPILARF